MVRSRYEQDADRMLAALCQAHQDPDYPGVRAHGLPGLVIAMLAGVVSSDEFRSEDFWNSKKRWDVVAALRDLVDSGDIKRIEEPGEGPHPDDWNFRLTPQGRERAAGGTVPKQIQLFTVFLASPSGLESEREAVRRAVAELNRTMGRAMRWRIEVVGWEEVPSSAGADPQDVINRYIAGDYDVFLALMGADIGSPTARADSGTIEEYDRALERFDQDPEAVELMLYFEDERTLRRSGQEPSVTVQRFRERVRVRVLDKTFEGVDDLERVVRADLARVVTSWETRGATAQPRGEADA